MAIAVSPAETTNGHYRPSGRQLLGRVEPAFRDLVKEALDQGALLRAGHGKHPMSVVCPDGERLTLSQSSSDWRARKNATAFLNRHGLDVGPKQTAPKRKRPGFVPGNARIAHARAEAWLAMQPEDREFTIYDLAEALSLQVTRNGVAATRERYLDGWLASGKIHFVRYHHKPGQRGIGTKVYSRRKPLSLQNAAANWDATMRVLSPEVETAVADVETKIDKVDAVLDRIIEPLVELNGRATATETAPEPPESSLRGVMWRHISDALFSLAQAAEVAARLEG